MITFIPNPLIKMKKYINTWSHIYPSNQMCKNTHNTYSIICPSCTFSHEVKNKVNIVSTENKKRLKVSLLLLLLFLSLLELIFSRKEGGEGALTHLDVLIIWCQGCVSKVHPFGLINWCLLCQLPTEWPLMRIITGGTIERFPRPDVSYDIFCSGIL